MLPWAVRDAESGEIIGSTRYHDIVAPIDRVEIGWTWYAARFQRTHVNTTCKLLLLTHTFESLKCAVVGLRTDNFNFASQRAIERLGAKKDGVSQVLAFSTARNFATSSPCPSGFTFSNTFETLPEGSMTNVVRRIPMYLRPNIDFSPHAPYLTAIA